MNKYIDADKLKAEIERHIKHYEKLGRDDFKNGELYICQELLSFVKSLQQEQTEVDIEKEIEEHAINMPHGEFTHESECIEHEEWAKREFRYFYELGLNGHKKYPDINLKEEIELQISLLNGHHKLDDAGRKWHTGTYEELFSFARHFYELGLNARK